MQSLSARHPLQLYIANASRTGTAHIGHCSILENIFQQFPTTPHQLETIEPYIRPPWYIPVITLQLETSKESAKQLHIQLQANSPYQSMRIYTDGSGIANKIGAATFNPTTKRVDHQHLGSDEHFNVYTAELTAIHLAVSQWHNQTTYRSCHIFTDSQAAGKSMICPRRQSGQSIIKSTLDLIDTTTLIHLRRLTIT